MKVCTPCTRCVAMTIAPNPLPHKRKNKKLIPKAEGLTSVYERLASHPEIACTRCFTFLPNVDAPM